VVVSPLSISIGLAAIHAGVPYGKNADEIEKAFGWKEGYMAVPAHMLLAAFEKPAAASCKPASKECQNPDADWITNTFRYHATPDFADPISPRFRHIATKYFDMEFVNLGQKSTDSETKDAELRVRTHLQTRWRGNTFSMSQPHKGTFHPASGPEEAVEMLDSEVENYLYAKTSNYEAVALPCNIAYMIAVLPPEGKDIHELERQLAEQPEMLGVALKRQTGYVTMPTFRITFQSDLREPIEALGIKGVFEDLGEMIKIPKSNLGHIDQSVDIQVDKEGIRADAETIFGIVYGGIMTGRPFHVELNRPFVFLIRDNTTNALLFMGAVMNPNQK
jgi:serine protease inhibitor